MTQAAIKAFYDAFARLDGDAMQAAYAANARFTDPAFSLNGREEIGAMWRMLTQTAKAKGGDVWRLEVSQLTDHSAHWEPTYLFSATGRVVHNIIDSRFVFDDRGLIVEQHDHFDFWRWSRQALGAPGLLLGWSPMLRNKVRAQAGKTLQAWRAKNPA